MKIKKKLHGSDLKIIAMLIMFIDHFAVAIFNRLPMLGYIEQGTASYEVWKTTYFIMRHVIGRTAFPIFCFLIVEGMVHTKNRWKYAIRLFILALCSELPFDLALYGKIYNGGQNVAFTLLIGVLVIWAIDYAKKEFEINTKWKLFMQNIYILFVAAVGMFAAYYLKTDYDYQGVLLIVIFYILYHSRITACIVGYISFLWEPFCFPAFLLIPLYDGKRGLKLKYFFYIFYPLHLFLFFIIWRYLL